MSRKALKVVAELKLRAVSCPGVHLPAKDDVYLSMCFMGQYHESECLPAVFPLLFREKMTIKKIFRHAVDPGEIAAMLEYEIVRIELVQLSPPAGDTLACFEENVRRFLFPEPKLVPSFSGVDREVLMTRAPCFPGIAPRLEFSTKTTITECSTDAEIYIHPNVPMRPVLKRNSKRSSRPRTSSSQRKQPQSPVRRQCDRMGRERHTSPRSLSHIPRSKSLSPFRTGNTQHLTRLSLDTVPPSPADMDTAGTSQPVGIIRRPQLIFAPWSSRGLIQACDQSHQSHVRLERGLTARERSRVHSPLRLSLNRDVRFSPTSRRKSFSSSLVGGISEDDCSSSHDPPDNHHGCYPSSLWRSYKEQARHSRSLSSSHREWEEVHERVRGLLTTPKAVRRLLYGATVSEVDTVLARRSISPGPP